MEDTALFAVFVAALAVVINAGVSIFLHFRRSLFEQRLAEKNSIFDVALATQKVALELNAANRKTKQDLAEEVLAGFYEIERMMPAIRCGVSWGREGKSRQPQEGETDSISSTRDTYYVVVERLDRNREVIARLLSKQFRAKALFGEKAAAPFEELNSIVTCITNSAMMLITTAKGNGSQSRENRWLSDIWAGWGVADPISERIRVMIASVEQIFRPSLATPSNGL